MSQKEFHIRIYSHEERFFIPNTTHNIEGIQVYYAPLTIGCPSMLLSIDQKVFKKSKEEKAKIKDFKALLGKAKYQKFKTALKGIF